MKLLTLKSKLLSAGIFLVFFAFAKAQSTTTIKEKEYIITASDDRSKLLVMTDLFLIDYGIQSIFKGYQARKGQLVDLELQFIQSDQSIKTLKTENAKGIEAHTVVVNPVTKQIVYIGPKSGYTAKTVTVVEAAAPKPEAETKPEVKFVLVKELPEQRIITEEKADEIKNNKQLENEIVPQKAQEAKTNVSQLKAAEAKTQKDAVVLEMSVEELARMKANEVKMETENSYALKNVVIINSKAYQYKLNQGRTFVLDESGRTVLVLPAELSKQPFSGTISLNRLRYQFSLRDNVISLFNGAGEPVDITGKEL